MKGFTLIELLVVIGIMGLLGTVSVGGYNAMQRGMEERGVMQNVNTFIRTAYERAQIDRQPTAIYFWNETIRSSTLDDNEIVVGRAVAVRRQGRISMVYGDLLVDEFADLEKSFPPLSQQENEGGSKGGSNDPGANGGSNVSDDSGENTMFLYKLDNQGGSVPRLERSVVLDEAQCRTVTEVYLQGKPQDNVGSGELELWGFKIKDKNGVTWENGSAYGFEFAELTLPHNYIFGDNYSTTAENPVRESGTMVFSVVQNTGSSSGASGGAQGSVTVNALRPDGSGGLKKQRVGTNDNPY